MTEIIKQPITPLWIISLFVSLTESVLTIAVIKTGGSIQLALTAFVLIFPLIIAGCFFSILWNRPYVFYPPTEYGEGADVESYVQAMRAKNLSEDKLYENIKESIYTSIVSENVKKELVKALSPEVSKNTELKISEVLNYAAEKAAERVRDINFISIDSRPLLGDKDGEIWQTPYDANLLVFHLVNEIWHSLVPRPKPYTYGAEWGLKNAKSNYIYKDIIITQHKKDERSLIDVGIKPGMLIEVIPV